MRRHRVLCAYSAIGVVALLLLLQQQGNAHASIAGGYRRSAVPITTPRPKETKRHRPVVVASVFVILVPNLVQVDCQV